MPLSHSKPLESTFAPHTPKVLALVAPTASGKTDLALELATALNAEIFSIDSLSIYKHINIASAKPSQAALAQIPHYAIDVLEPSDHCSAAVFMELFAQALKQCKKEFLLIVGGSGFYLSCLYEGLSSMPSLSQEQQTNIDERIRSLPDPYAFLADIDPQSALRIAPSDTYRLHKLLSLYFATHIAPSAYFATHTRSPLIPKPRIYTIHTPKPELHARIEARTKAMLDAGLLDEARFLLETYGRFIQPFNAIGLKECLAYIDANNMDQNEDSRGKAQIIEAPQAAGFAMRNRSFQAGGEGSYLSGSDRDSSTESTIYRAKPTPHIQNEDSRELARLITTHTRQLAKRQATYIRAKFQDAKIDSREQLCGRILRDCAQNISYNAAHTTAKERL